MNLDHYRNFVTIADMGTLSAAAGKLLIAQPALTKQVQAFEEEYGAPLFIRQARHMELTEAGKILYDKAKSIIALDDAAYKEICACVSGVSGTLSLGSTPASPDPFINDILKSFHKKYPGVQFDICEETTPSLLHMVTDGIVEVAFVRSPDRLPAPLEALISMPEHLIILGKKGNKWIDPKKDYVDIKSLRGVPLSIPRGFAPLITDECLRAGFRPDLLSVSTTRYTTLFWARMGESLAIIPNDDPKKFESDTMICRDLGRKHFKSSRSLIHSNDRELSAIARQFIDHCQSLFEK